jgi:hypothetical protein
MPKKRSTSGRSSIMAAAASGPSPKCNEKHKWTKEKGDCVNDEDRPLEDVIGEEHAAKAPNFPYGKTCGNLWRKLGWNFTAYNPLTDDELVNVVRAMESRLGHGYDWSRMLPGGSGYPGACCSCW